MARLCYRWLLPLGHALVDVIVLSHFIWQGYRWQSDKSTRGQPSVVQTEPATTEGAVEWQPVHLQVGVPPDFAFLALGATPIGLISNWLRPEAFRQSCERLWDPLWFTMYEATALLFWFLIGRGQDSPAARLRSLLAVYLGLRFAFALLCWLVGMPNLGPAAEGLFWLALGVYGMVQGCRRAARWYHRHTGQ